jgi:hypothetical protein
MAKTKKNNLLIISLFGIFIFGIILYLILKPKSSKSSSQGEIQPIIIDSEIIRPGVLPETLRPGVFPETLRPGILPETLRPGVFPETLRPGVFPETLRPGVFPETLRPGVFPETLRPGVFPETLRPGVFPETLRPGVFPETLRPGVFPEILRPIPPVTTKKPLKICSGQLTLNSNKTDCCYKDNTILQTCTRANMNTITPNCVSKTTLPYDNRINCCNTRSTQGNPLKYDVICKPKV